MEVILHYKLEFDEEDNQMRECIRCGIEMKENLDVKVEGAAFGLKITLPGIFKENLGKVHCAACPECGYIEFYLEDIEKSKINKN